MGGGEAAGAVPFGVELYAHFPDVCSLWSRDVVAVLITEKFSGLFHHPETWVHIKVPLLFRLSLLFQVFPLDPLLPVLPPFSDFLRPSCFGSGISTQ